MNRRSFLKKTALALGAIVGGIGYAALEAKWLRVTRVRLPVPNLPPAFAGKRVVFMADFHHGPFVPLKYIRHCVDVALGLQPDLILLGGDYPHRALRYIQPCIREIARLRAPLGVYAVLGNHDHYFEGQPYVTAALREAGIPELTNRGLWIESGGGRLWICGVDDFWWGTQDLPAALGQTTARDAVILLSHNPDYAEEITDTRVGLVLSGHTHGGQVDLPIIGPPVVPSLYGQKYAHGFAKAPCTRVFVTRGLGTITPPVRFLCRPEVVLGELASA